MIKIKEKIKNIGKMFKYIFTKFPVLLIVILITTIILAIGINNSDLIRRTVLKKIMQFSFIFASGLILIETKSKKPDKKRIILYIVSAIIAFSFTYIINNSNIKFLDYIVRMVYDYCITTIVLAIYFNYKDSNLSFNKYVTNVATNIFKISIIYGLLAIGLAMITAVFIFLILNSKDYDDILRIEILLMGIYYIPQVIYSLYNMENEESKFIKILIKYVLDVLVIIAYAIIYLYIGKIFILRNIPSNQIFRITAALFAIGCPIWTMATNFNDEKALDKINSKLPILFIPFIFLQIYSITVRILSNGITEARYLCIMVIILEIIYIFMYIKNKEKIGKILITFIILALISLIAPYINMCNISNISQYNNLKIYKEKYEYSDEDKQKIKGAYNYLNSKEEGKKLINKLLKSDDIEIITKFNNISKIDDDIFMYANTDIGKINIEGYKTISLVDNKIGYEIENSQKINEAFRNVELNIGDTQESITLDLNNILNSYIANYENIDKYIQKHNEVAINENMKLIIRYVSISYNNNTKLLNHYSVEGFLLEK